MTISQVSIANRVADLVGLDPITSFEDGSRLANLMLRNYEAQRDRVLRLYPWNCAMARASLPAMTAAPAFGFAYQYQLPEGPDPAYCLRVYMSEMQLLQRPDKYKVEGRRILSDNSAPFRMVYIARITDPALFDPLLAEAIAAAIGVYGAAGIVEAASRMDAMRAYLKDVIAQARMADAQEGTPEERYSTYLLDARF